MRRNPHGQSQNTQELAANDCLPRRDSGIGSLISESIAESSTDRFSGGPVEIDTLWRPPYSCEKTCFCSCHKPRHYRTPPWLECLIGTLFWSYKGLPIPRAPCDSPCRRESIPAVHLRYFFPRRYLRRMLRFTFQSLPLAGPQFSLKTSRVVDAMAPIFNLTQRGEISLIKRLFEQHLASPLDTSHLGGRTPLHVCLEICPDHIIP